MEDRATYFEAVKFVLLCICWYASSSANNVVGKLILSDFPYPMTVSMVQLVSISVYLLPILYLWRIPSATQMPKKYWLQMILPLALGKFVASVSSHISIWKVPVSYAHTVKATMPLFVVLLARVLLGEKQTTKVYLSIIPIISGVAIATVTELSFNFTGLISALIATLLFALQNIYSKQCLKETGIHHLRLLMILANIAAVCFAPLWFFYDFRLMWNDTSLGHSIYLPNLIALLLIDGFCNFAQNMIAFTVIAMVTPVSYAVANATKRIFIITVSLITLKNPVTFTNVLGMLTAIFGVLLYNKAKYDQRQEKKKATSLPYTKSDSRLNSMLHPNGTESYSSSKHTNLLLQNNYSDFTNHVYYGSSSLPMNGYADQTHHETEYMNGSVPKDSPYNAYQTHAGSRTTYNM